MSVLLFSMFLLGVLVGKHLDAYPDKYSGGFVDIVRDRFSGLATATQQENMPSADETKVDSSASGKDDFDLTFYKVLGDKKNNSGSLKGGGSSDNHKGDRVGAAVAAVENDSLSATVVPVPEKTVTVNLPPGKHISSKKMDKAALSDQKKSSAESPAPQPSSLPGAEKKLKKGGFQVQAAACKDVHQAEKMVKRLKSLGYIPLIEPRDIPNKGRWFRVIAGNFENRQEAQSAAAKIAKEMVGVKCLIRRSSGNGV
jgi:cell division septation protein DedD